MGVAFGRSGSESATRRYRVYHGIAAMIRVTAPGTVSVVTVPDFPVNISLKFQLHIANIFPIKILHI